MITICMTYFRSLALTNLRSALHSVRWQDLSQVAEVVLIDNNTEDSPTDIDTLLRSFYFPIRVRLVSFKHGDPSKTHSWSMNAAVREAGTPFVFCTRADYILDASLLRKSAHALDIADLIVAQGYHLNEDVLECEAQTQWSLKGADALRSLPGTLIDYTLIDSGVSLMSMAAFNKTGGLDEGLTAWGHAQTEFQHRLYKAGARVHCLPEVLFYHPQHAANRDLSLAHAQLKERGIDVNELWKRHEGTQPYR